MTPHLQEPPVVVVLLAISVLVVYTPAGLTPSALRQGRSVASAAVGSAAMSTPTWVRAAAWIAIIGTLLFVLMLLHGGGGPGMHGLHG